MIIMRRVDGNGNHNTDPAQSIYLMVWSFLSQPMNMKWKLFLTMR